MMTTETSHLKIVPRVETPEAVFPDVKAMPELIRRHVTDDEICILTFDRPDSPANLFDRATELPTSNIEH